MLLLTTRPARAEGRGARPRHRPGVVALLILCILASALSIFACAEEAEEIETLDISVADLQAPTEQDLPENVDTPDSDIPDSLPEQVTPDNEVVIYEDLPETFYSPSVEEIEAALNVDGSAAVEVLSPDVEISDSLVLGDVPVLTSTATGTYTTTAYFNGDPFQVNYVYDVNRVRFTALNVGTGGFVVRLSDLSARYFSIWNGVNGGDITHCSDTFIRFSLTGSQTLGIQIYGFGMVGLGTDIIADGARLEIFTTEYYDEMIANGGNSNSGSGSGGITDEQIQSIIDAITTSANRIIAAVSDGGSLYTIWDKPFDDYTVTEGFLFLLFVLAMICIFYRIFTKGVL